MTAALSQRTAAVGHGRRLRANRLDSRGRKRVRTEIEVHTPSVQLPLGVRHKPRAGTHVDTRARA